MARTANTTPGTAAGGICITLSALAAQLGSLEAQDFTTDTTDEQWHRQEALFAIAGFLPVHSGHDAALALSAIADRVMDAKQHNLEDSEHDRFMRQSMQALAQVALWVRREHGAAPLMSPWPAWADPFDGTREARL